MLKPINLLLVEDDLAVREALANLLKSENYNVLIASNLEEAVFSATKNRIDVALVDLQLGGQDGWAVFRALKELDRDLPVMVGSAHRHLLQNPLVSRSSGALEKPFDLAMLLNLLAQAISPRAVRRVSSLVACSVAMLLTLLFPVRASAAASQVTGLRLENGNAILTWQGGGTTNQVQFQSRLNSEWQDLDIPTTGSSLTSIVTEPSGFYRVVSLPDVSAAADKKAPSTPTGLTARASSCNQIDLSWVASSDSGPNATGVLGYNIYRNGIFLKQVPAPATTASDVGLAASTTYSYTVLATDRSRNSSAKSSPASTTTPTCGGSVNQPPVANAGADVSVTVGAYATFNAGSSYDPDGSIINYQWDFGDGTSTSGSYVSHAYSSIGIYTVRLTVTDNAGVSSSDSALTTVVALADVIPPSVALVSPGNGTTVSGAISLSASANDNAGGSGVARVEFYLDNATTPFATASGSPYNATCNTTSMANGSHSFYCRAYDAAGNSANSASISVTVANTTMTLTGSYIWGTSFGGTLWAADSVSPTAIREDKGGNIYIAGSLMGTASFGVASLTSAGSQDILIAKYSATGTYVWAKRFGSTDNDYCSGAVLDSGDNLVVVGTFSGTVDFGGSLLSSAEPVSMFVAKYSSAGVLRWAKQFAGAQVCQGVAVDSADNILITGGYGYYGSSVNFGGGGLPLGGGAGQYDVFVTKLNSSGTHVWSHGHGGAGYNVGYSIAADASGDVVVCGSFQNSANFGGQTFTSAGGADIFLAKYSGSNGSHVWSKRFGGASDDYAKGIAVDQNGNVAMTGYFGSTVDFGGGPVTSPTSGSVYLVVHSSAGAYSWSRTVMPIYGGGGSSVAFDSAGSVILSGSSTGMADYGNGWYVGGGTANAFVAKYGGGGVYQWANVYGGSGNSCAAVSVGAGNRVLATGTFGGSIDLGGGTMSSLGGQNAFVVKFAP